MEHKTTNHRLHGITTDEEHHEHADEHTHEHSHNHDEDKVSQMTETKTEHTLIANVTEPMVEPEPVPGAEPAGSTAIYISNSIVSVLFSAVLLLL